MLKLLNGPVVDRVKRRSLARRMMILVSKSDYETLHTY